MGRTTKQGGREQDYRLSPTSTLSPEITEHEDEKLL